MSIMNDAEFHEIVVHTAREDVPTLHDRTAGQVMMKLAALNENGAEVLIRFNHNLQPVLETPIGTYLMILDSTGDHLEVEQIS